MGSEATLEKAGAGEGEREELAAEEKKVNALGVPERMI